MQTPQNWMNRRPGEHGTRRLIVLGITATFFGGSALAQESTWKENFSACAGNSPFIEGLLASSAQDHRPLMRIAQMQAWAITGEDGKPTVALTTDDGLTIIGRIVGPQGEDISGALLGLAPTVGGPEVTDVERAFPLLGNESTQVTPAPQTELSTADALSSVLSNLPASRPPAAQPVEAPGTLPANELVSAPITASADPTPEVQAGMNAIFDQATNERIWFSAAEAKPGAPVVYMLADPECPHCQWTIDQMHAQIGAGDIDLRIIFAPITGVEGFNTSLSILHADNVAEAFMSHMTSKTRGTAAVVQMDTQTADRAVVQGIVDNINWMRANRMPGVPFFLFMTEDGARFAFSELPSDILTIAKAL
ncbi:hypothetical protein [Litoreibacter roseus]|uniref:Thioredoxin-like fold domain-containing protein n=1 Tax=Litoreibacter roseus TaxID=2601869 RepID=A0A6N6JN75_9RHOB|nr:hypothetical protein [Litoreibacter roseus]GFE66969.1 hypothetical protein KIN_40430 [Litoreibacter roseus]